MPARAAAAIPRRAEAQTLNAIKTMNTIRKRLKGWVKKGALWCLFALAALVTGVSAQGQEERKEGFYDVEELKRLLEVARESGFTEKELREITIEDGGKVINVWDYLKEVERRRRARAAKLLPTLRGEVDAARGRGDPFLLPRDLPLHSEAELAGRLGPEFSSAVFEAAAGVWSGPIASAYGHHLVFVVERLPARRSTLESVRGEVREALRSERARVAERAELATLRDKWLAAP